MGDYVAGELKKFDVKDPAKHLKDVATNLQKSNFVSWNVNAAPQTGYLGCFDIAPSRLDKNKTKDLSPAQIVAALRNSGMRVQARHGRASLVNTQNAFATMDFAGCDGILKQVEDLVKQIISFESSADSKALEKTRQDLIEGGNHASAEVGKLAGQATDSMSVTERAYTMDVMKALANFNTTLTRWMTELTMPVTKKIYQTARSSLVLVEKSLNEYKAGGAAPAAAGGGVAS
jgi:hypothetical protein